MTVDTWSVVQANIFSPVVLCFFLGCISTLVKSDLRIPDAIYSVLTIYLLFALGLKGGVELSYTSFSEIWKPSIATLILGTITPLLAFAAARHLGKLKVEDSAALAAHYGSVSVVTFIAVQSFLKNLEIGYEGFLSAQVVLLEVPAILIGLLLAQIAKMGNSDWTAIRGAMHEILSGKSILLLIGGLLIGALSGPGGYAKVEPFFGSPFQGVVALFLLEMGIVASRRFRDLKTVGAFVLFFGTLIPIINSFIGVTLGHWAGLSLGGTVVLGTLAASASYIAAPAAVRLALPEANPGIYLTSALTVTFPFNLVVGIPLYLKFAQFLKDFLP
ncbi:sodium-dependent bicarbonate transport family permease [bacterium]|nr:sodium-dependent bicarbonate transport family permease [bacterium]